MSVICFFFWLRQCSKRYRKSFLCGPYEEEEVPKPRSFKRYEKGPCNCYIGAPQVIMAPNSIQFRELRGRGKALEQLVTDEKIDQVLSLFPSSLSANHNN